MHVIVRLRLPFFILLTFLAGSRAATALSVDTLPRIAPTPSAVGDAFIHRPRHQGTVGLTYAAGRLTAFGGPFTAPGYTVVAPSASVRLSPRLAVYGRVTNLTNRAYEETIGFPALRRQGSIGVRVAAGR